MRQTGGERSGKNTAIFFTLTSNYRTNNNNPNVFTSTSNNIMMEIDFFLSEIEKQPKKAFQVFSIELEHFD